MVVLTGGGTRRSPKSCEPSEPLVICIVTGRIVPEIRIFGYLSVLKFDKTFDNSFLGHRYMMIYVKFNSRVSDRFYEYPMRRRRRPITIIISTSSRIFGQTFFVHWGPFNPWKLDNCCEERELQQRPENPLNSPLAAAADSKLPKLLLAVEHDSTFLTKRWPS